MLKTDLYSAIKSEDSEALLLIYRVIHNYWYWTPQLSTAYLCQYSLYLQKNFEATEGNNTVKCYQNFCSVYCLYHVVSASV